MSSENFKEFLNNNNYLENTRAGIFQRCQNSLWQTSPEMMAFSGMKKKLTNIMS